MAEYNEKGDLSHIDQGYRASSISSPVNERQCLQISLEPALNLMRNLLGMQRKMVHVWVHARGRVRSQ